MPEQFQGLRSVYPVNMGMPAGNKPVRSNGYSNSCSRPTANKCAWRWLHGKRFVLPEKALLQRPRRQEQGPKEPGTAGHRYDVHVPASQSVRRINSSYSAPKKARVLTRRDLRTTPEQGVHIHLRGEHGFHTFRL